MKKITCGAWKAVLSNQVEYETLLRHENIRCLKDPNGVSIYGFGSLVDGMAYTAGPPKAVVSAPPKFSRPPPKFSLSVGRVFKPFPSGRYGCCGAAVAFTQSKLLSARHLFEEGEDKKYEGRLIVFIASQFLTATIDDRNVALDIVSLVLEKPCAAIEPLWRPEPIQIGSGPQPALFAHFPLSQDNAVFNAYKRQCEEEKRAKNSKKAEEEEEEETNTVLRVHVQQNEQEDRFAGKTSKNKTDNSSGIPFVPGQSVPQGPVVDWGLLGTHFPKLGQGYADYPCSRNSSGGAVVIDTSRGWQLLGVHLEATASDGTDSGLLTHVFLSPEQVEEAGIKPEVKKRDSQKRKSPTKEEECDDACSLPPPIEERTSIDGVFLKRQAYFAFIADIESRLGLVDPPTFPMARVKHYELYDYDTDSDNS